MYPAPPVTRTVLLLLLRTGGPSSSDASSPPPPPRAASGADADDDDGPEDRRRRRRRRREGGGKLLPPPTPRAVVATAEEEEEDAGEDAKNAGAIAVAHCRTSAAAMATTVARLLAVMVVALRGAPLYVPLLFLGGVLCWGGGAGRCQFTLVSDRSCLCRRCQAKKANLSMTSHFKL
jgi:hypothetical protein